MASKSKPKRMTIDQIEALLEREEECEIQILPNGEIVRTDGGEIDDLKLKPLTMRENLGGEYAQPV